MAARIEVTPELIAKGRYLYEQTDTPVDDIAAMFTMSRWTLNGRIRQHRARHHRQDALMEDRRAAVTHAETRVNAFNLAPNFLDTVVKRYHGTRLGRQEIEGEIIEQRPDALWTRSAIECRRRRARQPPARRRQRPARSSPPAPPPRSRRAGLLLAAGQSLLSDENVNSAVQTILQPKFIPYYVIAIGLITELARRRTASKA